MDGDNEPGPQLQGAILFFSLKKNKQKFVFRTLDWLSNICGWQVMAKKSIFLIDLGDELICFLLSGVEKVWKSGRIFPRNHTLKLATFWNQAIRSLDCQKIIGMEKNNQGPQFSLDHGRLKTARTKIYNTRKIIQKFEVKGN